MSKKINGGNSIIRGYSTFTLGLVLTALGIAFTTGSNLGTSPISAIPYAMSIVVPRFTIGVWTIIFSLLLILIQLIIEKKKAKKVELALQLLVTFPFGMIIDLWIYVIDPIVPSGYVARMLFLVAGCFILALGVYFQVKGGVVMLPGDAFVRSVSKAIHREFGRTRMVSDILMSAIAFAICIICLGRIEGIREGTIVAALLVGNIVRLYRKIL